MRRFVLLGLLLILCWPQMCLAQGLSDTSPTSRTGPTEQPDGRSPDDGRPVTVEELTAKLAEETEALERDRRELEELAGERARIIAQYGLELELAGEMGSLAREAAGELLAGLEASPVTVVHGLDLARLRRIVAATGGVRGEDIEAIIDCALKYMEVSSSLVVQNGTFVDRDGREREGEILLLGNQTAVYRSGEATGYLGTGPDSGRLLASAAPPAGVRRVINAYLNGETDAVFLDISRGAAVAQLSMETNLWERVSAGGVLVWPILLIGLAALFLVLERIIFLIRVRRNTDGLMTTVTGLVLQGDYPGAMAATDEFMGRPTGNVLRAGLGQRGQPRDIMESGLSEAILREMPRLERFIPTLRVLATVAPLLGLLGTVTGLIKTFHVITLYGSGDPRLMAGGIGEALVTTQLGLAVAIPIMIVAALLNRQVQRLVGDMEEKALALMSALLKVEV